MGLKETRGFVPIGPLFANSNRVSVFASSGEEESSEMSNGETYGSDKLKPAVRRKRWGFFVPLLFFALGALSALGLHALVLPAGVQSGMKTASMNFNNRSRNPAEQVLRPGKKAA